MSISEIGWTYKKIELIKLMPFQFINSKVSNFGRPMAAITLSFLALYFRVKELANRDLWIDELYIIANLKGPLKHFLDRGNYVDVTFFPGDYYLIYPFYAIFGEIKWALMAPHIMSTIIGFIFLYLICQRYMRSAFGFMIAFGVVCFNSQLIFHSFELRPYAVLITFAMACFYFTGLLVEQKSQLQPVKKYLIGAFSILGIWFHAYGILIVSLMLLYHLIGQLRIKKFKEIFRDHVLYILIVYLIALPLWFWYNSFFRDPVSDVFFSKVNPFQYIPNPMTDSIGFLKGIFGNLIGNRIMYLLLIGFVLSMIIPHKDRWDQIGFFLILVVLPIELIFIVDMVNVFWFLQRQFVWVMPFFAILLGWQWDSLYMLCKNKKFARINKGE